MRLRGRRSGCRPIAERRRRRRAGFTLVEVAVSSVVVAFLAMASATAFTSNLRSVEDAERITLASIFLETVMEDVSAQDYDDLLGLNGNQLFDTPAAANANWAVRLTVFQSAIDLLQIEAELTDLRSGRVLGSVTTARADR